MLFEPNLNQKAILEGGAAQGTNFFKTSLKSEAADDLKGIKKKRYDPQKAKEAILLLIAKQPLLPKDLAAKTGYSSVHVWRYCKALEEEGKIEKSGDYWKKKGTPEDLIARQRIEDLVDKSKFLQLPVLEDFVRHVKGMKSGQRYLAEFRKICTGQAIAGFKVHPESWTAETTEAFIKAYQDAKQNNRLPYGLRQLLRYVHEYVLHTAITQSQKDRGLDGAFDVYGKHSHIQIPDSQIAEIGQFFLDKGDLESAAYFRGGVETFGRPNAWYVGKISDFHPVEKQITLAHVEGIDKPVTDPQMQMLLRLIGSSSSVKARFEQKKLTHIHGRLFEAKTNVTWAKRIRDSEAVRIVLEYMASRKKQPHFFQTEGESWKEFMTRMGGNLRSAYKEFGLTEDYFVKKPLYTLRHFGAHLWLRRTGYNYGIVAAMGWENTQILQKWYGGFDEGQLDKHIQEQAIL